MNCTNYIKTDTLQLMPKSILARDTEWINWYKAMRSQIGRDKAAIVFLALWDKRGTSMANTRALRQALDKDGISIDENIFNYAADIGGSITDFFGDIINAGKFVGFAVGGILIIGLGVFVYNISTTASTDKLIKAVKR